MKRKNNGKIVFDNEEDLEKYVKNKKDIMEFIDICNKYPIAWEKYKIDHPDEVRQLRDHLGIK